MIDWSDAPVACAIASLQAQALGVPALEAAKAHRRWLQWLQEGLYGARNASQLTD